MLKVALIQMNAGNDRRKNLNRALRLTIQAIRRKAKFILLPEVFNYRGRPDAKTGYQTFAESIPGPSTIPLMLLARKHKVFILAGSLYEKSRGARRRVYNTSVLINDRGRIQAKYRKVNLFQADFGKQSADETVYFKAGTKPAVTRIKGFKIGMSICYDLRFPQFFQRYKKSGVDIIVAPSSFTATTGQAHWEILLRARAVENLCYVLAPNQFGKTASGIATYGNSMAVDPWGRIAARASRSKIGILYATIDARRLSEARRQLPGIIKG